MTITLVYDGNKCPHLVRYYDYMYLVNLGLESLGRTLQALDHVNIIIVIV